MDGEGGDGRHPRDGLVPGLGLGDAVWLVVASVVGAGIFLTPGRVAELLPSPGWILAAWVAGGVISLAGALALAELGAMMPRAGGDYVYLSEAFHPLAGFLVGWLTFFVIYAGTIAALAAGFAERLAAVLALDAGWVLPLAILVTLGVSGLNAAGLRWGARANNGTSIAKVGILLLFCLIGPWLGEVDWSRLWTVPPGEAAPGEPGWRGLGLALSPVLFSYLGWNASVYVASELHRPARVLPASLLLGLALCTALYLLLNGVYLASLPLSSLAGTGDAGQASALALLGPRGSHFLAVFVLLSVLGTLNAMVLVGPRIAYAMALDGLFFRGFDRVHASLRTPVAAIALQAAVAVGLLGLLRSFPSALDYTTFAIVLATLADTAALYRLRRTRPDRPRPYRAWGYPWLPGLYMAANGAVALALLFGRPRECAIGLLVLSAGLPFYAFFRRRARRAERLSAG